MAVLLGLPLIGSYTNTMLYMVELIEAYIYYFASPRSLKDPIFLKCCVATSLVSDTVGTIGVCAMISVITGAFSDAQVTPGRLYWGFQMYITSNMTSAFIFQSFMVIRYWTVSHNYIVSSFIALLALASLGTTISLLANNLAIVTQELFRTDKIHVHERWIVIVLATAMLTDISITTALLWQLNRSLAYNRMNLRTRQLLARISSQAIRTGVVPCIFALITLASYVSYNNQSVASCFAYMLGRVYTSTLLFSLIYRDKLRTGGGWIDRNEMTPPSTIDTEPTRPTTPVHSPPNFPNRPAIPALAKRSTQGSMSKPQHDVQSMSSQDKSYEHKSDDQHPLDILNSQPPIRSPSEKKPLSLTELGVIEL